jgi:acetyl esterase/lipase
MPGMLADFLRVLVGVLGSRIRRGPAHPGWSFRTELLAGVMRRMMMASKTRGIPWLRETLARVPKLSPARRRVRFESVDAGGVPSCWCMPRDAAPPARTVLYLHGGGYVIGSPDGHSDALASLAAQGGLRVLAPDYRLAPEHPFPAAQEDAIAAYRYLLSTGADPDRLAVAGDSAGGALALATLLQARDDGDPLPAAAVLLCPWVDPTARGGSLDANAELDFGDADLLDGWFRAALGDADPAGPLWSPSQADLHGLPPLLVQWGGAEILRDQIRTFVERARVAGLDVTAREWESMFHDWMMFGAVLPEAGEAMDQITGFLDAQLAR